MTTETDLSEDADGGRPDPHAQLIGRFRRKIESDEYAERIPERIRESLLRYVDGGIKPGRGLRAVVAGDLFAAARYADDELLDGATLRQIMRLLVNHAPPACYGSEGNVDRWAEERR